MTDPQKDEHIEELLSKLQGIFGKLSHSEEEEASQQVDIPSPAPKEPEEKQAPLPAPPKEEPPKAPSPAPLNFYSDPPSPAAPAPPPAASLAVPAAMAPGSNPPAPAGNYESVVPTQDSEKTIVSTAVFYPPGREAEAKSLAQKLETMTPKFTKIAFRLRVVVFMMYDPKSEWKETISAKTAEVKFQTVFVVMERPMDDPRRKAIVADLEPRSIYFQEVLTGSIEKKAFYTDVLLGLVFFFDSRKPNTGTPEGTAP